MIFERVTQLDSVAKRVILDVKERKRRGVRQESSSEEDTERERVRPVCSSR